MEVQLGVTNLEAVAVAVFNDTGGDHRLAFGDLMEHVEVRAPVCEHHQAAVVDREQG